MYTGVEVRPLIATQYNIQSKQFLSVGVTMVRANY